MTIFRNLYGFFKEKRLAVSFSAFIICGLYLFRMIHYTIGIDTEMALADYGANLNWIMGGGRFSGVLLRKIVMPLGFNYHLALGLTVLVLLAADFAFIYVLDQWGVKDTKACIAFCSLFLTFPTFAEIFYFTSASYSIATGLLLSILVAYLISEWVYDKKPFYFLGIGLAAGVFTIGLYQAFLFLIVSEIVALFILKVTNDRASDTFKTLCGYAVKLIAVILLMGILYYAVSAVCIRLFYREELLYAGYTKAQNYISGQIAWGRENLCQCFINIKDYILKSFARENQFGSALTVILPAFIIVYLFGLIIKRKKIQYVYSGILFLALFVTPYLGVILKGQSISEREQIILPFVLAFYAAYILNYVPGKQILKGIFFVFIVYSAWIKLSVSAELFQTDWIRYENDYATAKELMSSIEECGSVDDKAIVFLGGKEWKAPENLTVGEMIGASFFTWDQNTEWGINYRVYYFMKSIGFTYRKPELNEILTGKELLSELDVWPKENSIRVADDMIVVKLSD